MLAITHVNVVLYLLLQDITRRTTCIHGYDVDTESEAHVHGQMIVRCPMIFSQIKKLK